MEKEALIEVLKIFDKLCKFDSVADLNEKKKKKKKYKKKQKKSRHVVWDPFEIFGFSRKPKYKLVKTGTLSFENPYLLLF